MYSLINNAIFCFIFFRSLLFADGIKVKGMNIMSIHEIQRLVPIENKIWTKLIHPAQNNAGLCKNTGTSLEAVPLCSCAIKSLIQWHFWLFQWKEPDKPAKTILFSWTEKTCLWILLPAEWLDEDAHRQVRFTASFSKFEWQLILNVDDSLSNHHRITQGTVLLSKVLLNGIYSTSTHWIWILWC